MMSSPSELSLDCKPHSYSLLLKSISGEQLQQQQQQRSSNDQTQKLEEFLSRLEEERLKIDAFKRELPLCMQLLTNAMEDYKKQLQSFRANQGPRPVLEEFIPLKTLNSESSEKISNMSDKATWMTTAQLWSQSTENLTKNQPLQSVKEGEINFVANSPKLGLEAKQRNAGAFLPFSKERKNSCPNAELALAPADKEMEDKIFINESVDNNCSGGAGVVIEHGKNSGGGGGCMVDSQIAGGGGNSSNTTSNSQTHRKARRCWSPDLHRRFVNALNMLGGSQVATPKQIRELMKVDGLTNDEVKSHLQKYRLHTRRPSPSSQVAGAPGPQLVVLGSIWVPPEYAAAHHHHGGPQTGLYGPGHPSPHYCPQPVPQEFYHAQSSQGPPHHHQLHHHTLHHQLHMYNNPNSSRSHGSPESDVRGGAGDRSESIEDGKSEGSSWKADSGERKAMVVREDGEESNESDITLKF